MGGGLKACKQMLKESTEYVTTCTVHFIWEHFLIFKTNDANLIRWNRIGILMGLNVPLFRGCPLSPFPLLSTLGLKSVLRKWSFVAFTEKVPPFFKF